VHMRGQKAVQHCGPSKAAGCWARSGNSRWPGPTVKEKVELVPLTATSGADDPGHETVPASASGGAC
jgi:hypothetical protein